MARKPLTKKQKLQRQYRQQIRRIEKGYHMIEIQGGSFSKTVEEIIKPVKTPTEATIKRLRGITRDVLYRQAKTETGESGWKLRTKKYWYSSLRSRMTRFKTKLAREKIRPEYWENYSKRDKEQARERYYSEWQWEHEKYFDVEESKPVEFKGDTTTYSDWEEANGYNDEWEEGIDKGYETDYTSEMDSYVPDFTLESEMGTSEDYRDQTLETIQEIFSRNEDSQMMRGIKSEFEKMQNEMTDEQLRKWLQENQEQFIQTIEDVEKYKPTILQSGQGISKFGKAMDLIHGGITPLDSYDNPMATGGAGGGYGYDDRYYDETDYTEEDEDEEEYEDEDDSMSVLDIVTGEVFKVFKKEILQRVDKWGREHYQDIWVDENGFLIDLEKITQTDKHGKVVYDKNGKPKQVYRDHYRPISDIEDNEDYM